MPSVIITKSCPFCGRPYHKVFDADAYRKWQDGPMFKTVSPTALPMTVSSW